MHFWQKNNTAALISILYLILYFQEYRFYNHICLLKFIDTINFQDHYETIFFQLNFH